MKQAFVMSSTAHEMSICDSWALVMPCSLLRPWTDLFKLFAFVEFMALRWRGSDCLLSCEKCDSTAVDVNDWLK